MKKLIFLFLAIFLLSQPTLAIAQQSGVTFFVEPSYDSQSRSQLQAILKYTGQNAYFYVESDYYNSLPSQYKANFNITLQDLAQEFDSTIYPKERELLGSEWKPGIDNDSRIIVLLSSMVEGVDGYFRPEDEYSNAESPNSNEREMIYLNAERVMDFNAPAYLAHEFQHLINFHEKSKIHGEIEEIWLNESFSEYMPTYLGYNSKWQGSYLQKRVQDFLNLPPDSLLGWEGESADYASISLFIHYLADHYGEDLLKKIITSEKTGISAIEEAIKPENKTFKDVFTDWSIANYVNNIVEGKDTYIYKNPLLFYGHFHTSPRATFNLVASGTPTQGSFAVKDWQADYYKFQSAVLGPTGENTLKVEFAGQKQNSNFVVSYILTNFDGRSNVGFLNLNNQQGVVYINNFGIEVISVVMVVSSQYQNEPPFETQYKSFSFEAILTEEGPINYPDGSLLRAKGDTRVYISKGGYKRWIQSPEIFNSYGHLRWSDIIEVDPGTLVDYEDAWLVRVAGDYKVYEINGDGTKHWLRITAREFEESGRRWDMVYEINRTELNFYIPGPDVLFR